MAKRFIAFVVAALASSCAFAAAATYEVVQAVFNKHCVSCHDAKEAEGGLVLDSYASLMKGGESGPVVVAGHAEQSLLYLLASHQKKPFMPPPKKAAKVGEGDVAAIKSWIDGGARPPAKAGPATRPVVPSVKPKVASKRSIYAMAASPDGKVLAVARHGAVELVSAEFRHVVRTLEGHAGNVNAVAFSADGTLLAAGSGEPGVRGQVTLWSVNDGKLIRTLEGHDDAVYAVALSTDRKTLASGSYDQRIILWAVEDGKQLRTLDGHNGSVTDLAFRKGDAVLASASADRTVKLWDVKSGGRLDTFSEPLKELHTIAFSPDGSHVLAAGVDSRVRVWAVSPSGKEGTNKLLAAHFASEGAILRIAFAGDGRTLVTAAEDKTVKTWTFPQLAARAVLPKQPEWPTAVAAAGKLLAVGRLDGSLAFYDIETGKDAPAPKPEVASALPRGVQRGNTVKIHLTGKNLAGITAAKSSVDKVVAKVVQKTPTGATLEVTAAADTPLVPVTLTVSSAGGDSNALTIYPDDLPEHLHGPATPEYPTPAHVWAELKTGGDADLFPFNATAGQTIVIDTAARRIASKANLSVAVLDANGRPLRTVGELPPDADPLVVFTAPSNGRYVVRVSDRMAAASANEHFYRLTIGTLPYVTGAFPTGVPIGRESKVMLLGHNLPPGASVTVNPAKPGEVDLPLDPKQCRIRSGVRVVASGDNEVVEAEPNDDAKAATPLSVPAAASGRISSSADVDLYRFEAKKDRRLMVETVAARRGSPIDTKVEVLDADGKPVERVLLRAVRDSWINFRNVEANAVGARLQNWEEMELNQLLYFKGEVVKLHLYPRGPDSEYNFYPAGNGRRRTYFDTSAVAHALEEPCYIVEPHAPGTSLPPNGLPVFKVFYANDDDGDRELGPDSRIHFTAPADGTYLVRVSDVRGHGSERHTYRLQVRPAKPDFGVTIDTTNPSVPIGGGRSFGIKVDRIDGFDGPIRIDITGAPPGFTVTTPIVVEAGHLDARGTIFATADAAKPTAENQGKTAITATATVENKEVVKPLPGFGTVALGGKPPITVTLRAMSDAGGDIVVTPDRLTPAMLKIDRGGFKERVSFDVDNLPHGVIVADIGLNGVLITEAESERQIFLQCAPWVEETTRLIHARAREAGNVTSAPVTFHVRRLGEKAAGAR